MLNKSLPDARLDNSFAHGPSAAYKDKSFVINESRRRTKRIPAAGLLNAKTLAEENLRGFRLKSLQKENDLPLRVNCPQRIELPMYFNTPRRKEDILSNYRLKSKMQSMKDSALNMSYIDSYNRLAARKRLKDYAILSFACKRAGKSRDEGRAYYSTGVLFDNLGKFKIAISHYKKFLQVCKAIGDVHGEALAYNCIGVNYQKIAEGDVKHYKEAIDYHLKHKEIADVAGKFLAHVNLGIIYNNLGDQEKSSINHQFALRYAIQMSSLAGQSVAVGNLGNLGSISKVSSFANNEKLQMFVERYLELSSELKYRKGEGSAHMQLGQLKNQKGDYDTSTKHFYRAMKIAEQTGDNETNTEAKVMFGMANANLKWDKHQTDIMDKLNNSDLPVFKKEDPDEDDEEEEAIDGTDDDMIHKVQSQNKIG
jgi:tetratricopeptide (TPR) repeat protein